MSAVLKLKKQERLKASRDFQQVYARGRRISGPHLTIFFKPSGHAFSRLGLSVRKKRFKLSCRRNYIQRRVREAFRLNKALFSPGYDIVISVQRLDEERLRLADLQREILSLAGKARLLKEQ